MEQNKQTFFELIVTLNMPTASLRTADQERIQEQIDLLYTRLHVGNTSYEFQSKNAMLFLFKVEKRKRLGLVTSSIHKALTQKDLIFSWEANSLLKTDFEDKLDKYTVETKLIHGPSRDSNYSESDIKILDFPKNHYKWQKTLLKILFEDGDVTKSAKTPDPRSIILIRDSIGRGGKTIFLKWLLRRRE
jgi:hypothetical protein